jgi:hypothetical protein
LSTRSEPAAYGMNNSSSAAIPVTTYGAVMQCMLRLVAPPLQLSNGYNMYVAPGQLSRATRVCLTTAYIADLLKYSVMNTMARLIILGSQGRAAELLMLICQLCSRSDHTHVLITSGVPPASLHPGIRDAGFIW